MSEEDKLALVSRMLAEGKGDRVIAAAIDGTRHDARKLIAQVRLEEAKDTFASVPVLANTCIPAMPKTAADYAQAIAECWQRSVEAILEAGRLLCAAKEALDHGEFGPMIESQLPFGAATAQRLMAIARDERLQNPHTVQHLPPSWGTLYEIKKLDGPAFESAMRDGLIRPDMERQDAVRLVRAQRSEPQRKQYQADIATGCTIDDLHALVARGAKFRAIYADPPWKFLTRSPKGEGRSASEHYTTHLIDKICALPVPKLAADDAVLFLWIVDWDADLAMARAIMAAWGFSHKTTAFTWAKENPSGEGWHMGQGYWTRANPETCLLATRGNPKRLNADVRQLIVSPVMEHSEKPEEVHGRIERLVAGPYLELYGRKTVPNWVVWGDQIPREEFGSAPVYAAIGPEGCPHLHRALARVAQRHGERSDDLVLYSVSAALAPYFAEADRGLGQVSPEEFEILCDIDDPRGCKIAKPGIDSAIEILCDFVSSLAQPEAAE